MYNLSIFLADSTVPKNETKESEVASERVEIRQTSNRNSARYTKIFDDASVEFKAGKELDDRKATKKCDSALSSAGACSQAALACSDLPSGEEKEICLVLDKGLYNPSYLSSGKASPFATYSRISQSEAQATQHLPASSSSTADQIKKRKSNRQKGTELSFKSGK